MSRVACIFIFAVLSGLAAAQDVPVLETYVFDPYQSNPAMVAIGGYSQLNLVGRKQWADIPNAPVTFGINGQFVVTPRISVGGLITHDKSVLLSATTALATFAYQVPFADEHFINFGLSGGFYTDRLRLDGVNNVNDPALYANDRRFLGHAQFGVAYIYKDLRLGFALPQLLDTYMSGRNGEVRFSPLRSKILNAMYRIEIATDISFNPFAQYFFDQNAHSILEAGGLFDYKKVIKLGAFFREEVGVGVLAQLTIGEMFQFGYVYQARSNVNSGFGGSSNELQLKFRVGRKRDVKKSGGRQPEVEKSEGGPVVDPQTSAAEKNTAPLADSSNVQIPSSSDFTSSQLVAIYDTEDIETFKPDIPPYLVVGCFRNIQNAERLLYSVINRYPNAGIGYINSRSLYFVYTQTMSESDDISVDTIMNIRKTTAFKDAWFMKVQQKE